MGEKKGKGGSSEVLHGLFIKPNDGEGGGGGT